MMGGPSIKYLDDVPTEEMLRWQFADGYAGAGTPFSGDPAVLRRLPPWAEVADVQASVTNRTVDES